MNKMDLKFYSLNYQDISLKHKDEIYLLLRQSFASNFTGLLSFKQVEDYIHAVSRDVSYKNCCVLTCDHKVVGFAVSGNRISLTRIFTPIRSFIGLCDGVLLALKLLSHPKIIIQTLKNIAGRNSSTNQLDPLLERYCYLAYICVAKHVKSRGVGSDFMSQFVATLRVSKIPGVYCHMDSTDLKIRTFYLRNDWIITDKKSRRSVAKRVIA